MKYSGFVLGFFLLIIAGPLPAMTDPFDTDPLTNPEWELYQPLAGVTFTTENGFFRGTIPSGLFMDHWLGADLATQLRRSDMPEDFILETRLRFVGSGDPANPTWPPVFEAYTSCLIVYFSQYDVFYWGPQSGTNIVLQRSGTGPWICSFDPFLQEYSLQVKKEGTKYSFSWRANDGDPWELVCTTAAVDKPQYVGLMFKTWGPIPTFQETFEYDYFTIEEVQPEAPSIEAACPLGTPDIAWIGMPYLRTLAVSGIPTPEVTVTEAPPDLLFDPLTNLLAGWTPDSYGTVPIQIEAANASGTDTLQYEIDVAASSSLRDDDFDADPTQNLAFWEFWEPQRGIVYSIYEPEPGSTWWRLEVPQLGEFSQNFDHWVGADLAPQLRHAIDPGADFLIETRVRIAPEGAPPAADEFLAGLMIWFSQFDLIHWNVGQERNIGGRFTNLFLELAGINNIAHGRVDGLLTGVPVRLRCERKCSLYNFYYQGEGDEAWTLAGSYRTDVPPVYVGLIIKTWGDGSIFTADFDYFDIVTPGPKAIFTVNPEEGVEPLEVAVDGSASSSPGGDIIDYSWDFGDGSTATGRTQSHTYAANGDYRIVLMVTDSSGDKGEWSRKVSVKFRAGDVSPWTSTDVGDPPPLLAGQARKEAGGCLRVQAGGKEIGLRADQFHFLYQEITGDGSVAARLDSVEWSSGAKVGVMLREDLSPGSRHAAMLFNNASNLQKYTFLRRDSTDAFSNLKTSTETFTLPTAWVRIERQGDDLIGSFSPDGLAWTELSRTRIALPAKILGGIAATSRDMSGDLRAIEAQLCDVTLKGGEPEGPSFRRGDTNDDGKVDLTDAIVVLGYLFQGAAEPPCFDAADSDDSGVLDLTDGIFTLTWLFQGGPEPPAPGPKDCGLDTTPQKPGQKPFPTCVYRKCP